jgi:hypothetical protein
VTRSRTHAISVNSCSCGRRFVSGSTVSTARRVLVNVATPARERAGAASAIGQASAFHGVARPWVERARCGKGAGVSRTTAANWSRRYKTYGKGHVVGFVPALERLSSGPARSSTALGPGAGRSAGYSPRPGAGRRSLDPLVLGQQASADQATPQRQQRPLPALRRASPGHRTPGS